MVNRKRNLDYLGRAKAMDQANLGLTTNKLKPESIEIWYSRLGLRTFDEQIVQYLQVYISELSITLTNVSPNGQGICATSSLSYQHKEPITRKRQKPQQLLDVVHSDVCGTMQVSIITGQEYFVTFIDKRSGRISVTLLKNKSEGLGPLHVFKGWAIKEDQREIRSFRTDGGGEYTSREFKQFLWNSGIAHSVGPPYTPSYKGLAERGTHTLMESDYRMIDEGKIDLAFWGFAVATTAQMNNQLPSPSDEDLALLHLQERSVYTLCTICFWRHLETEMRNENWKMIICQNVLAD